MIRQKKGFTIFIIAILMLTILTGCSPKKTPKEALSEAILKEEDINTSEFKIMLSLNVNSENIQDPEFDLYANMLNNGKVIIEGKSDLNDEKLSAEIKLDLGGMSFNAKLYQYDNKMALKIPFLAQVLGEPSFNEKYILMDLDQIMEEAGAYQGGKKDINEEEFIALYRKVITSSLDALREEALIDNGTQAVEVGGKNVKAREIQVVLNEEDFISVFKNFFMMLKDDDFRNELFNVVSTLDPYMTKEDFDNEMIEVTNISDEDIDDLFTELKKEVDFKNFKVQSTTYIDSASNIVKSITEANINIEEENQSINFGLQGDAETWNINKPIEIEIPEISESNSIDFSEFLYNVMFSSFY